jgi:16S rRNA (guanine966-N2)-methyltransferase
VSLRLSNGRRLLSPPGDRARPTAARVREALFNQLQGAVAGRSWLELCCGSAAMSCEALLQGAERVLAVEQDHRLAVVARRNLQALGEAYGGRWQVVTADVRRWLKQDRRSRSGGTPGHGCEERFDFVFADPPYRAGLYGAVLEGLQDGQWLSPSGRVWLEAAVDGIPILTEGWRELRRRRYGNTVLLEVTPASAAQGAATAAVLVPGGDEQAEEGDGDQAQNDAAEQGFDHGTGSGEN